MSQVTFSRPEEHEVADRRRLRYAWMGWLLHYPWTIWGTWTFPERRINLRKAQRVLDRWLQLNRELDRPATLKFFDRWLHELSQHVLTEKQRRRLFHDWLRWAAAELLGSPANWCGSFEQRIDGTVHFHGALGDFHRAHAGFLQGSWIVLTGGCRAAAKIEPFRESCRVQGISYIIKHVSTRSEALPGGPALSNGHREPQPEEWRWLGDARFRLRLRVTEEERDFFGIALGRIHPQEHGLWYPVSGGVSLVLASLSGMQPERPLAAWVSHSLPST